MDVMALDAGKRIEATVQKLRDTSRDNALVLRSTAAGSAASRTQAFLVNCVRTPLSGLTEEAILSYAATRAVFEAGFKLKLQSRTMAQSGSRPAKPRPLPNASYHQRTNFATMPHWQAINATGERVAEELVPSAAISKILQSIDPVIPSAKPGFGPYHSAKKRCVLLGAAAERMGLPSVPLVSLMDLQRHGYFADRCIFEDVDHDDEHENDGAGGAGQAGANGVEDQSTTDDAQSSQQAMPAAAAQVERSATRLNSISVTSTSTRSTAALAAVEGSLKSTFAAQIASSQLSTPAIVAAASAMAKPSNAHKLHRIRAKAEREKRLAGADLSRADPGADIPGAAVFEWTRRHGHQAQAMLQQAPSATEEFWLCLKGIVFLADTRTIEDAGRRLYYDMVLIPLYTGRDVTSAFAKMALDDRALSADDQVTSVAADPASAAAAEDDEMNWGINSDDEDDFGGPWAEVCRAEQELDFTPQVPCSLTAARLRNQYRHRESAFMTSAQRKHVDRVFEMIARDFPVIGVLDDASRELWL